MNFKVILTKFVKDQLRGSRVIKRCLILFKRIDIFNACVSMFYNLPFKYLILKFQSLILTE